MKNNDKVCSIYKSANETYFVSMWRLEMGIYMMGEVVDRIRNPAGFEQAALSAKKTLGLHKPGIPVPGNAKSHADSVATSLGFRDYKQMASRCDMYLLEESDSGFALVSQTKDNGGYIPDTAVRSGKITKELFSEIL